MVKCLFLLFIKAGEEFKKFIVIYVEKLFCKGVLSLFEDLRNLYENLVKVILLEDIFIDIVCLFKESGKFLFGGAIKFEDEKKECVMYAVNLFVMYYDEMGCRLSDGGVKEFVKVIECIDEVIVLNDLCVELYLNKAIIFEYVGDL